MIIEKIVGGFEKEFCALDLRANKKYCIRFGPDLQMIFVQSYSLCALCAKLCEIDWSLLSPHGEKLAEDYPKTCTHKMIKNMKVPIVQTKIMPKVRSQNFHEISCCLEGLPWFRTDYYSFF